MPDTNTMPIKLKSSFTPHDSTEDIIQKILQSRGISTQPQRQQFLHPPKPTPALLAKHLDISPQTLTQFKTRILQAITNQENICIFGDYDADGITSTAILWQTLHQLGAKVLPFIPHRQKHGYGLSRKALEEILSGSAFKQKFSPTLLITTDTGIVAHKEIAWLKQQNLTVILTDHHQPTKTIPPADIIIHSPATSAAGIAFLLAQTLLGSNQAWPFIELAALGVVADQIPLLSINRSLVAHGLKALQSPTNKGLQALYRSAGVKFGTINTYTLNFIIAPRINAMGRLKHGLSALRLLCSQDPFVNQKLASILETTNLQRQTLTHSALTQARQEITEDKLLIVASDAYHEGVIGLIAGKLVEETGRPAIAISLGPDLAKGSARSIPGVNITHLLRTQKKFLTSVGGHELAAGFSLKPENLPLFIQGIKREAEKIITPEHLQQSVIAEGELVFQQINHSFYQALLQLQPFGLGNPRPHFLSSHIRIIESAFVGKNKNHLKLTLAQGNLTFPAIWFQADKTKRQFSQVVYSLNLNTWGNQETLQLVIHHVA